MQIRGILKNTISLFKFKCELKVHRKVYYYYITVLGRGREREREREKEKNDNRKR